MTSMTTLKDTSGIDCKAMVKSETRQSFLQDVGSIWFSLREGKVLIRPLLMEELRNLIPDVDQMAAPSPADSLLASDLTTALMNEPALRLASARIVGQDFPGLVLKPWLYLRRYAPSSHRLTLSWDWNSADTSLPQSSARPGRAVFVDRLLMLAIEEKGTEEELEDAKQDVEKKAANGWLLKEGYLEIHYVFAYASAGTTAQRGLIRVRDGKVFWESRIFSLDDMSHRLELMRGSISQFRLLPTLLSKGAPFSQRFDVSQRILRANDIAICFEPLQKHGWCAIKQIKNFDSYSLLMDVDFSLIQQAYWEIDGMEEAVRAVEGPYLQEVEAKHEHSRPQQLGAGPSPAKELASRTYWVAIHPLLWERSLFSLTEDELKRMVRAWLRVLEKLHSSIPPLVHTNVRAKNTLWINSEPRVTDFESVHISPFVPKAHHSGWMPPGALNAKGCYTPESDVFCVGAMMDDWQGLLDAEGAALRDQLLAKGNIGSALASPCLLVPPSEQYKINLFD